MTDDNRDIIGSIAQAQAKFHEISGVAPDTVVMNEQDYKALVEWARIDGYIDHGVSEPSPDEATVLGMKIEIVNILPRHIGVFCSKLGGDDE